MTFSGSALPDDEVIGKRRLPVGLYALKVVNWVNCKQLGHTPLNIAAINLVVYRAEKSMWMAQSRRRRNVFIVTKALDMVSKPADVQTAANPPDLQQCSRRSYAKMLRKAASSVVSDAIYSPLPLDDQGSSDSEIRNVVPFVFKGPTRRRVKLSQRPSKKPRKLPQRWPQSQIAKSKVGRNARKPSSSCGFT